MSKKIQISTVKQTADVQVINLNAYFVAKAIKAQVAINSHMSRGLREPRYELDENAKRVLDDNGKPVILKDENGKVKYSYDGYLTEEGVDALLDVVKPFLDELVEAFEE